MLSSFAANRRRRVQVDTSVDFDTGEVLVSLTRQSEAPACDINNIMKRYEKTGDLSLLMKRSNGEFVDLPSDVDFMSSMNIINEASTMFDALPARVRKEFDNNPARFLEFAQRSDSMEKLVEWGLAKPRVEPEPQKVQVVNMPAPAGDDEADSKPIKKR